jgi:hypothetical protein
MTRVLIRRQPRETGTQREHVIRKAKIGRMHVQAKGLQRLTTNHQN